MNNNEVRRANKKRDDFPSLNSRIEQDSTINSTVNSESTSVSVDSLASTLVDGHSQYCNYKRSGECICDILKKYAKDREKRRRLQVKKDLKKKYDLSSSSSEEDSDYSQHHEPTKSSVFSLKSTESLEESFYTAEARTSKASSTASSHSYESAQPFTDLSNCSKNDIIHETSNNQSIISCIKESLYSHLKNEINPSATDKIEPIFKRLSIIAQEKSNDNSLTERLTDIYQVCQQDPREFASKLATVIEESTLPADDSNATTFFNEIFTKFKNFKIQDESLPSFLNRTSPMQLSEEVSCQETRNFEITNINKKLQFSSPKIIEELSAKNIYISTPKALKSSQASPLFISTMIRYIGTNSETPKSMPETPSSIESPSTPCGTSRHNESSFTYLEKKYVGKHKPQNLEMPPLTKEEKRSLLRYEEQLKALQESPCRKEMNEIEDSIQDSSCLVIMGHKEADSNCNSPCLATAMPTCFKPIETCESPSNVDESILHEYVTQRRRCLETEKTIREIQAASLQTAGINCDLLNTLTRCSDYQKDVKIDNKCTLTEKKLSTVSMKSTKGEKRELNLKSKVLTPKNTIVTKRTGVGATQSEKKLSNVKTPLSRMKIKSSGIIASTESPVKNVQRSNIKSSYLAIRRKSRSPSPSLLVSRNKNKSRSPIPLTLERPRMLKTPIKTPSIEKSMKIVVIPPTPTCSSTPCSQGKYFGSLNKTPIPKKKPKNFKYFITPESKKENKSKFQCVRSPIRDYIHGKDMFPQKKFKEQTNENFLSQNEEKLKTRSIKKENNENEPASSAKKLGVRREMLKEVQNSNLITRHEGHVTPEIIDNVNVKISIHVTKEAERTLFHLKTK